MIQCQHLAFRSPKKRIEESGNREKVESRRSRESRNGSVAPERDGK